MVRIYVHLFNFCLEGVFSVSVLIQSDVTRFSKMVGVLENMTEFFSVRHKRLVANSSVCTVQGFCTSSDGILLAVPYSQVCIIGS